MPNNDDKVIFERNVASASDQLFKVAAVLLAKGVTQPVLTEAFFRVSISILITDLGLSTAIENLQLGAMALQQQQSSEAELTGRRPN